jgi:hypothetical protein
MPNAVPVVAEYSGPTTMAPITNICEFVMIPTATMRPAIIKRLKRLETGAPVERINQVTRDIGRADHANVEHHLGKPCS